MVDSTYRAFCNRLEVVLDAYESCQIPGEPLLDRQRQQLLNLIQLEAEFQASLDPMVYSDFVTFIVDERHNILAARPYFRERSEIFVASISGCFKDRLYLPLRNFRLNWSFVEWASKTHQLTPKQTKLRRMISNQRNEILEQNLPLAISQARIFWKSTPRSHLSFMDVIQIQCQGLLLAVDKFVPPNEKYMSHADAMLRWKSFRAVAIGIMRRDRVNAYSETSLHFFPSDRLKMYRAHKLLRRHVGETDYNKLAEDINKHLSDVKITTNADEIQGLLAAGSTVSADFSPDPEADPVVNTYPDNPESRPDLVLEGQEAASKMYRAIFALDLRDRKMLMIRGVR